MAYSVLCLFGSLISQVLVILSFSDCNSFVLSLVVHILVPEIPMTFAERLFAQPILTSFWIISGTESKVIFKKQVSIEVTLKIYSD